MKLVIDIPNQIYDDIKQYKVIFAGETNDVLKSVINGIPLKDFLKHMKEPINEETVKSYIKQIKNKKY
jgi:hypothetical protein